MDMNVSKEAVSTAMPSIAEQTNYWDQRWHKQRAPNGWQTERSEAVLRIARRLPLEHPKILDLGCGTGFTTRSLSVLGDAEGIDLSPTAINIAKAKYPSIAFRAGDLYDLSLEDEAFDLVVCQEVIPHVTDQPGLVAKIAAATRTNGYLIMTAANKFVMKRLKGGDGGPIGSGPLDPAEHIKRWLSTKELSRLMESHFQIVSTTSILPVGNRGILRLINSHKINRAVGHLMSQQRLDSLKGRLGWGYTIIVVGQKRTQPD